MTTQFLERPGAKIAYDVHVPQEIQADKLLVLVNGYRRPRTDFRALRKRLHKLCPGLATLCLDNRFCGETTPLDDGTDATSLDALAGFTLRDMADDVSAVAEHVCQKLGLKTYALLGISMGGMVAQTCAAGNPHVHHLMLVSTTTGGNGRFPALPPGPLPRFKEPYTSLEATQKYMKRYFGDAFLQKSHLMFEMMCKTIMREYESSDEPDAPAKIALRRRAAAWQFDASIGFDGVQQLSQIQAPTTIFSGDHDQIITIESAHFLHKNIPHSTLVVYEGVGHLILMEEPDKFCKDVATVLQQGENHGID